MLGAALLGLMAPCMAVAGSSEKETVDRAPSMGRDHAPMILRERHERHATSSNWSGYAVTGPDVTDVKGSWTVPAVTGPPSGIQYSSFWVGIDGYDTNTVEQIGTDSDCVNGSPQYYAWYEFYPKYPVTVTHFPVSPGDVISADVSYSGGEFTVTIMDCPPPPGTGKQCESFTHTGKEPNAKRASAEWIIEASGGQPLADFGTVTFDNCSATVNKSTAPIDSSVFMANLFDITMIASGGTHPPMSQPSALSTSQPDPDGFMDTWLSAGP